MTRFGLFLLIVLGGCADDANDVTSETLGSDLAGIGGKADGDFPESASIYGMGNMTCEVYLTAKAAKDGLPALEATRPSLQSPPGASADQIYTTLTAAYRFEIELSTAQIRAQPYDLATTWVRGWLSGGNQFRFGDVLGNHQPDELDAEIVTLCEADRTGTVGSAAVRALATVIQR